MYRNFNDPQYKKWRLAVYRRDKFKCKRCSSKRGLQAHHIRSWAEAPDLRFVVDNGITLCKKCHGQLKGQENGWEWWCRSLLARADLFLDIKFRMRKLDDDKICGD